VKRSMKTWTWAGLLVVLLAAPALAETARSWTGPRVVVKAKHLAPAMKKSSDYWDKYTFNADFGARGSFYYSLAIGDALSDDRKLEAKGRLTVDGKTFSWRNDFKEGAWSHTLGEQIEIKAGKAVMSGTPDKLRFVNEQDGGAVELEFTPIARAWRPRQGQAMFGSDNKAYDVTLFPLMKVTGRFKHAGGDWQNIEGRGQGSHVWGEMAPHEAYRWTMEMRGISGDTTVYLRELGASEAFGGVRIPYLLVTKGDKVLVESFDYQLTPTEVFTDEKHDNKYKVPTSFQLVGKDADDAQVQFRGAVKQKKLNKRKDYLADLGAMKAAVASRFAKPVLYDYEIDLTLEVKTAGGVERITMSGDDTRYEVNWLNP